MPRRYTSVVILGEDRRHCNFVRRFLERRGIEHGRIRMKPAPAGQGAGEQHVRLEFPKEVDYLRCHPYLCLGLVAVIDCDARTIQERKRQLDGELTANGQTGCTSEEPIAVLTPRRNIETWIFHLRGNEVTESDDYAFNVQDRDIQPAVAEFASRCPQALDATATPPALKAACTELQRLLRLQGQA